MNYLQKSILIIIIAVLLTGCTTAKLMMKLDPTLKTGARVYEVTTPDSWSPDKKLNVSFGPYRVMYVDAGWGETTTETDTDSETGGFLSEALFKATGISSGNRNYEYDPETIEVSKTITYEFTINGKTTWYSECVHIKEYSEKDKSRSNILSSHYTCQYARSGSEEPWVLSIEKKHSLSPDLNIKMTNGKETFTALSTRGVFVSSDGKPLKTLRPPDVGYTWTDARNKSLAAISFKEETQRVWLNKGNPDSTSDILAMASTGLLVYKKKIEQTLR